MKKIIGNAVGGYGCFLFIYACVYCGDGHL